MPATLCHPAFAQFERDFSNSDFITSANLPETFQNSISTLLDASSQVYQTKDGRQAAMQDMVQRLLGVAITSTSSRPNGKAAKSDGGMIISAENVACLGFLEWKN